MELSAVGLVQGGGPEQGASTASMASSANMAEVEKRKSFADMKLVDFTSGFSNFEVSWNWNFAVSQNFEVSRIWNFEAQPLKSVLVLQPQILGPLGPPKNK